MSIQDERDVDAGFWRRADEHIHLANGHCATTDAGKVSASMLYAASRFNAFIVASSAPSAEALSRSRADAIEYFTAQFRAMLAENIDDHIKNFAEYSRRKRDLDA